MKLSKTIPFALIYTNNRVLTIECYDKKQHDNRIVTLENVQLVIEDGYVEITATEYLTEWVENISLAKLKESFLKFNSTEVFDRELKIIKSVEKSLTFKDWWLGKEELFIIEGRYITQKKPYNLITNKKFSIKFEN